MPFAISTILRGGIGIGEELPLDEFHAAIVIFEYALLPRMSLFMADSVEKVGSSFVVSARCSEGALVWWGSRGRRCGHRDQLGHLAKVLSGCSEGELVACDVRPS